MPNFLRQGPTLSLPANKTTQTNVAFGTGDGATTVFTVSPPTGFPYVYVNTVYRTDWQGAAALSASARTNQLRYSEQFDNSAWAKVGTGGTTVIADTTTAPNGTTTADKIIPSATTGTHYLYQSYSYSASTYTVSVFVKAYEYSKVRLFAFNSSVGVLCNLNTGVVSVAGGAPIAYGAVPLSNGWYRLWMSATAPSSGTSAIQIYSGDNTAGDGTSGFYVWGAQLETGTVTTPYIPTTTAPVTVYDYTVSGLTYTFAETPLTGAILSYDGMAYHTYSVFYLPTCGVVSFSASGITSGKLRLTASVDGSNFNATSILPYDKLTGALASSSDLPNGLYTVNTHPFKALKFTQTDATDTVTISTALGR